MAANACAPWALVPAAGSGSRMGSAVPKQYLPLAGQCVLEVTLNTLLQVPGLEGILVALPPEDTHFATLPIAQNPLIHTTSGGSERARSVLLGLKHLRQHLQVAAHTPILVHDAARPCVTLSAIARLLQHTQQPPGCGLLASPIADTLKVCHTSPQGHPHSSHTQDRSHLWAAHTPQVSPLGLLIDALEHSLNQGLIITDEASALEHFGLAPLLVQDRRDNLKVTHPEDLALAEQILAYHRQQAL